MTLTLEDTSDHPAVTGELLSELTDLVAFLYAQLGLHASVDLEVTLVDEAVMEQLHLDWMDLPGATDVMSFPMDQLTVGTVEEPVAEGSLGDVVLCPAVADSQAEAAGHSTSDELCLLTTHGVLHLLGYDHDEPEERAQMFSLQKDLLEAFLQRSAPTPTTE